MRFVLDTTVVSALMRSDPEASRRLLAVAPDDVGMPQPVLAELRYGLARLPKSRRRTTLETRLSVLADGIERVAWNDDVSRYFGEIKVSLERRGMRVDDFDVAIAAHALANGAAVVTDNVRHFSRIRGLKVERWTRPSE